MRIIAPLVACVALFFAILAGTVHAGAEGAQFELLTVEEAARPAQKNFGFATILSDIGPSIEVPEIEVKEAGPFALEVRLTARDGVAADLTTVRVECLKSPIIDLTPRVRQYITSGGLKIDRVSLPPGLHHFRMSVNDVRGRLTEKDFTIVVSGIF